MKILRTLDEARKHLTRSVVTIGNFDGVHIGHQDVFNRVKQVALARHAQSVVLTFEPHPVLFFRPDIKDFRLMTRTQKIQAIQAQGIDAVVMLPFDTEMASKQPQEFVDEVLYEGLSAVHVIVGEGFRFGNKRAGGTDELDKYCVSRSISSEISAPTCYQGDVVSSTRIRNAVATGNLEEVSALLGRPYCLMGTIEHGDGRGRKLGFPTANMSTANAVLPPNGVYITHLILEDGQRREAITNVGVRPTFGGTERVIETFVLDASDDEDLDLYEQQVELVLHAFIRAEQKFDGPEQLISQIEKDIAQARKYFKSR